jgi:hypothetical protein
MLCMSSSSVLMMEVINSFQIFITFYQTVHSVTSQKAVILTLPTRTLAVLTEILSWFSSFPPGKCWDSTSGHICFLPNPLQFIILPFSVTYSAVLEAS